MQKEVEQWPVLLELACLLPHLHLHLLLVSPDVPQAWHCRSALFASPNLTSCSGTDCSCAHAGHGAEPVRHMLTVWRGLMQIHGYKPFVPSL